MKFYIDPNQTVQTMDKTKFLGFTIDADQFQGDSKTSCLWELKSAIVKNLCRELRPATIRIGGSGIDSMYFVDEDPSGEREVPGKFHFTIDRQKCDALGEFCRETGAGLMLSLPVRHGDIENAERLADYFINLRKDEVPFLEMANEPDWGWKEDFTSYPEKVEAFYKALAPKFPRKEWIAGYGGRSFPFGICNPDSTEVMKLMERCGEYIDVFSAHYYVDSSSRPYCSSEFMLGEFTTDIGALRINELKMLLSIYKLDKKVAINEFNTFAGQGLEGVSNTMMAAVWTADFIGNLARCGSYANNLQCGFGKQHGSMKFWRYALIDTREENIFVNPHYYAFYLWNRLMGDRVVASYSPSKHPVAVHATLGEDDRLQIMIVNKDLKNTYDLALNLLDYPVKGSCEMYTLSAESPESRMAAINGHTVKADGNMEPIIPVIIENRDQENSIKLKAEPCSVVVLRY